MAKSKAKTEAPLPPMIKAMMAMNPAANAAWFDVMAESARFVSDRLQQDMETQRAMLECRKPADLIKVQSEFYQTALEQYMDEAKRLMTIMTEAGEETSKIMKTRFSRNYDDVPL